jgi:hypothetical protein
MRLRIFNFIITIAIFHSLGCSEKILLEALHFEPKANGILLHMTMDTIPKPQNITAWQANSGWFYITLYKVKGDSTAIRPEDIPSGMLDFQVVPSDESLQLGLRLKEPIENYGFSPNHNSKTVLASLHYSIQYLAELDTIKEMKRPGSKKGMPDGIKKWLYLTGTGITLAGLMQNDDPGLNHQFIAGISLLLSTFLIDKIWQSL